MESRIRAPCSNSYQGDLYNNMNTTYFNILKVVAEGYPTDSALQALSERKMEGKDLYNQLARECDEYDRLHPNETIANAVRHKDLKCLSSLDTFTFLSDKLDEYSDNALEYLGKELKELFIHLQLLRTCNDKWHIISPIVDAIQNTSKTDKTALDWLSIKNFVTDRFGSDNKLADQFNDPSTIKHMMSAAKMVGLPLHMFETQEEQNEDRQEDLEEDLQETQDGGDTQDE